MKGLEVTRVDPFGPAVTYFGLQVGDVIVEIGMQDVGGPIIDSPSAGGDFLTDAFAKNYPIKVRRGDQVITLPSGAPPAPGTGAFPQANPSSNNRERGYRPSHAFRRARGALDEGIPVRLVNMRWGARFYPCRKRRKAWFSPHRRRVRAVELCGAGVWIRWLLWALLTVLVGRAGLDGVVLAAAR